MEKKDNVTYGTTVKIMCLNISISPKAKFVLDAQLVQGRYLHAKQTLNI
jgi:hypothetical protein